MNFLKCTPSVFVIENDFVIVVNSKKNGIISIEIDGKVFYEENNGVLFSEKNYAKIRIPQSVLDEAKAYSVVFRETINRRGYGSLMGEKQVATFDFKPLTKTENINIYHVADVHYHFDAALNACTYFGEDVDLFVINGDIGEVETVENYEDVLDFVGKISLGKIPVIFTRGNHDARGKLAERFTDYFVSNGVKTYYTFSIGCLNGVVLDCGEDKKDNHVDKKASVPDVYGGVNVFHQFREKQTEFLKNVVLDDNKIKFAVSHICPSFTIGNGNPVFDIEKEIYADWIKELERINIKFMLFGHLHVRHVLKPFDPRSTLPANYHAICGAEVVKGNFVGAAITLNKDNIKILFTDNELRILGEENIKL